VSGACRQPPTYCGDGIKQSPNSFGFSEECENTSDCAPGYVCDECVCSSIIGTYCGDGDVQHPNAQHLNEQCESTLDCAKLGFGPNYVCDTCSCTNDPSATISGFFITQTKTAERATFDVLFNDTSPATFKLVYWNFYWDDSDFVGTCLKNYIEPLQLKKPSQVKPKKQVDVSDLNMTTVPGKTCRLTAHAKASHFTADGTYLLNAVGLGTICPSCTIQEIPSVIHPIGMYSTKYGDALNAYNSATLVVSQLRAMCPACSSAANAKLSEANSNLDAAGLFAENCKNDGDLCRLSQYYSARARELANGGLSL
jgi:hypothetical protein